ncbi:hypothetical protein Aperf_G00000099190 [Anoplocephala perfoliata]
MARREEEFVLDLCVHPFENEFEEEYLEEICNSAIEQLRNTVVDSDQWNRLKKDVLNFKRYLVKKAIYFEYVAPDVEKAQRARQKLQEVTEKEAAAEAEARGIQPQIMQNLSTSRAAPIPSTSYNRQIPTVISGMEVPSTSYNRQITSTTSDMQIPSTSGNRQINSTTSGMQIPSTSGNRQINSTTSGMQIPSTSGNRQINSTTSGMQIPSTSGNRQINSTTSVIQISSTQLQRSPIIQRPSPHERSRSPIFRGSSRSPPTRGRIPPRSRRSRRSP